MTAADARIPLAGTSGVQRALRRSRVLRLGLGATLVALLAAALLLALDRPNVPSLLPPGSNGVIVLDVSGSIGPREFRQVAQALDEANSEDRRYGLVAFSDVPYEVFPPGTDSGQLRAISRFFVPARGIRQRIGTRRLGREVFLASPWAAAFTGGTVISRALNLAREIVNRDRLGNPAVVLISDLDYDPKDATAIAQALSGYRRDALHLRVVGVASKGKVARFFEAFEVPGARVAEPVQSVVGASSKARASATASVFLAAVCAALLVALALTELACGRLTWLRRSSA